MFQPGTTTRMVARFSTVAGERGSPDMWRTWSRRVAGCRAADVLAMVRIRIGGTAAEHLFSVACGLDSMAVGEDQIVAQIKGAARAATAAGTTGPAVTSLIDAALRASKRARTQTTISTEGISLARAGLDLARAHLGGLAGRDAVVLGTGPTGELAARLLREGGVGQLSVASCHTARAAEMAAAVRGGPLQTSDVPAALADADVLVTATGAAVPVAFRPRRPRRRPTGLRWAAGTPLIVEGGLDLVAAFTGGLRQDHRRGPGSGAQPAQRQATWRLNGQAYDQRRARRR